MAPQVSVKGGGGPSLLPSVLPSMFHLRVHLCFLSMFPHVFPRNFIVQYLCSMGCQLHQYSLHPHTINSISPITISSTSPVTRAQFSGINDKLYNFKRMWKCMKKKLIKLYKILKAPIFELCPSFSMRRSHRYVTERQYTTE